jgi:hypothetical protein
MRQIKCYFRSGAKGAVTGVLIRHNDHDSFIIISPERLHKSYGKDPQIPLEISVSNNQASFHQFEIIPSDQLATGTNDDSPSIYSYWIRFIHSSPTF